MTEPAVGQSVGRYVLYDQIASGGMASVHMGRLIGPVGFSRVVAIKRLHAAYAQDPGFAAMLLDEARLASRIRHPNVVPMLDVVAADKELLLVMEYVHGATLARLLRQAKREDESMPPDIGSAVIIDILRGLHAAHEARNAAGEPLGIIHRDVSPQNILVATDGSARLLDFGVAKAASRSQSTDDGQLKGKLGYISPEQLSDGDVDRRVDIFATSVVAWECITGRRLFAADDMVATLARVMDAEIPSLREAGYDIPETLEKVIERGLARDPSARFQTAEDMAREVEAALRPASRERVGEWVKHLAGEALAQQLETMRRIETGEEMPDSVQVPVTVNPEEQSGKVTTLRESVIGSASVPSEDPGTFPSTLATQSIAPPKPAPGWRRGALVVLAVLIAGVLLAVVFVNRPIEHRTFAAPRPVLSQSGLDTAASAAERDGVADEAPSASAASSASPPDAAAEDTVPKASAKKPIRPARTPSTGAPRPRGATPKPPTAKPAQPVDPLADQR